MIDDPPVELKIKYVTDNRIITDESYPQANVRFKFFEITEK
jgi:hypothetical protein